MTPRHPWLGRVRHDLVKRLLWPARDRRDAGGPVRPGELAPTLVDEEGRPVTAEILWAAFRQEAPAEVGEEALDAFEAALGRAVRAARRDELAGVLALEHAFAALARTLEEA